jgi:hypothetical protein
MMLCLPRSASQGYAAEEEKYNQAREDLENLPGMQRELHNLLAAYKTHDPGLALAQKRRCEAVEAQEEAALQQQKLRGTVEQEERQLREQEEADASREYKLEQERQVRVVCTLYTGSHWGSMCCVMTANWHVKHAQVACIYMAAKDAAHRVAGHFRHVAGAAEHAGSMLAQ